MLTLAQITMLREISPERLKKRKSRTTTKYEQHVLGDQRNFAVARILGTPPELQPQHLLLQTDEDAQGVVWPYAHSLRRCSLRSYVSYQRLVQHYWT